MFKALNQIIVRIPLGKEENGVYTIARYMLCVDVSPVNEPQSNKVVIILVASRPVVLSRSLMDSFKKIFFFVDCSGPY